MSSTKSNSTTISLPGIHEMLPEHVFQSTANAHPPLNSGFYPPYPSKGSRSRASSIDAYRDVARSYCDHRGTSVYHPLSGHHQPHTQEHWDHNTARRHTNAYRRRDDDRRHACPHCDKRFNRPSSLSTHINTHTGEKPYQCPYPGCYRRFNVNSNMRRHYRNHGSTSPLLTSPLSHSQYFPSIPTFQRSHSYCVSPSSCMCNRYSDSEHEEGPDSETDDDFSGQAESSVDGSRSSVARFQLHPMAPTVTEPNKTISPVPVRSPRKY